QLRALRPSVQDAVHRFGGLTVGKQGTARLRKSPTEIPTALAAALAGAVFIAAVCVLVGDFVFSLVVLYTAVVEGACLLAIITAAGGFGYLVVGPLAPAGVSRALKVSTACIVGLAMLWTAVLCVGLFTHGLLTAWVWWPVIGAGVVLAACQARRWAHDWRPSPRVGLGVLVWMAAAVAAAIWIAGASRPPGFIGGGEAYDVLEYHLQMPRQYYNAGQIAAVNYNCYSYYPLGVETLFLLAMCLRGGAYEGMYLANYLHGLWGVLAAAAVFWELRPEGRLRAWMAALLLATAPGVLSVSWVAITELAQLACIAVATLWLRHWIKARSWRAAACVGVVLGAACATKYLAVGFVAGPVLVAMLIAALRNADCGLRIRLVEDKAPEPGQSAIRNQQSAITGEESRGRRLLDVVVAGLVTLLVFSPWLVRNAVWTGGNPVFPIGTSILGRAYWTAEEQKRWAYGTGPADMPPVPEPAGWKPLPAESRAHRFWRNFLQTPDFGWLVIALAAGGILWMVVRFRRTGMWEWCLAVVLGAQLGVWIFVTHQMPPRFMIPAVMPLAMLAVGALDSLGRWRAPPGFAAPVASAKIGSAAAVFLGLAAVVVNFAAAVWDFGHQTGRFGTGDAHGQVPLPPIAAEDIIKNRPPLSTLASLPAGAHVTLVGNAQAFYMPPGTVYATPFDPHPLAVMANEGLTGDEIMRRLRAMRVVQIWVHWSEVWRLANTYGYPASLSEDLFDCRRRGGPPRLKVLDELMRAGMRPVEDIDWFAARPYWEPRSPAVRWPTITIYQLPP
ncbi:MAG: ArnT family glycosyltransferase, partial [Phycisphaerae bacterium]